MRRSLVVAAVAMMTAAPLVAVGAAGADAFGPESTVKPASGPPGTTITLTAGGSSCTNPSDKIVMTFVDAYGRQVTTSTGPAGGPINQSLQVPGGTALGQGQLYYGCTSHPDEVGTTFTVSGSSRITIARLQGANRDLTSVAASQSSFAFAGRASAAVIASDASFADALAGAPLAARVGGPLLLTTPGGLDPAVATEIGRIVPKGKAVYVLGGAGSVDPSVDSQLQSMGYTVQRVAGADRFATAVAVAKLINPNYVLEVNGLNYPDGLAAGAAASTVNGAIVLTDGNTQAPVTAQYVQSQGGVDVAIGGAAAQADPKATPIYGPDRYYTAVLVAQSFFPNGPDPVGFASGAAFPDALAGSANMAVRGGPLLLVPPSGPLPPSLDQYLHKTTSIDAAFLYGGLGAVDATVEGELAAA